MILIMHVFQYIRVYSLSASEYDPSGRDSVFLWTGTLTPALGPGAAGGLGLSRGLLGAGRPGFGALLLGDGHGRGQDLLGYAFEEPGARSLPNLSGRPGREGGNRRSAKCNDGSNYAETIAVMSPRVSNPRGGGRWGEVCASWHNFKPK